MAKKLSIEDVKKELTARAIAFDEAADEETLAALLDEAIKAEKEMKKAEADAKKAGQRPWLKETDGAPVQQKLVAGKAVDLPVTVPDVPLGIRTINDHEQRITAIEVALGIKKII